MVPMGSPVTLTASGLESLPDIVGQIANFIRCGCPAVQIVFTGMRFEYDPMNDGACDEVSKALDNLLPRLLGVKEANFGWISKRILEIHPGEEDKS